ncbi:MAG TPA: hypothetical protein DHW82_05525 [Spirochaetia bacterium]|nr:MAG: hypothetical protein A2Y41_07480 [Spirochaetes bacterium GWB1_36_13]HCL56453.1 hypothetical protein [Spirochaetia bacterium]
MRTFKFFLTILIIVNAIFLISNHILLKTNFQMEYMVMVLIGFSLFSFIVGVVIFSKTKKFGPFVVFVPFLAVGLSIVCALLVKDGYYLKYGKRVEGISVKEASKYSDAYLIQFTDGKSLPQYYGSYRHKKSFSAVTPIVQEDWKEGEAVPLWAVCDAENCMKTSSVGLVISNQDVGLSTFAVGNAMETHQLKSKEPIVIVRWIQSVQGEIDSAEKIFKILLMSINGLWLLVGLIVFIRKE